MLENLFNSKLKRKLLNIFFKFPRRGFYINELKSMTSNPPRAILYALREFNKSRVINFVQKKKKRYWGINNYFPYYNELHDLVMLGGTKFSSEDEIAKKLKKFEDLKLVLLSGIFTMQPQLTVDLLLVGENIERQKLQKVLAGLEEIAGQEINYAIMDFQEFDYRRFLHDRLIRDILDNPHLIIFNNL